MRIIFLALLIIFQLSVFAQEVISNQGDSYNNGSNILDFTIGEPFTETLSDGTNNLTQGLHQTIITILSVKDFDESYSVNIFPNPTSEEIIIDVEKYQESSAHLYNLEGKLLKEVNLTEKQTRVNVRGYPVGTYFVSLVKEDGETIKTYKIIKK